MTKMPTMLLGDRINALGSYCTTFLDFFFFISLIILSVMVQKYTVGRTFGSVINLLVGSSQTFIV